MFADASALVAIITKEDDADQILRRLNLYSDRTTSPLAVWEAARAVERVFTAPLEEAGRIVEGFLHVSSVVISPIPPEAWPVALEAHSRFGKGRHPARLNLGDCFAYACAKLERVPLLYKGDDFALTDIKAA